MIGDTKEIWVVFATSLAMSVNMAVFWIVAQCSLEAVYHCFKGACYLHHQGNDCPRRQISSNEIWMKNCRALIKLFKILCIKVRHGLLTNLTEEGVQPLAVVNFNCLVSEHCASIDHINVLYPYSIIVLVVLLLLS